MRIGLDMSLTRLGGGAANAYLVYALADDFDNSAYWQTDTNAGTTGTTKTAPSGLAGYTFTAAGSCYELNSDGTVAGPFGPNVPAITDAGFKARQELTNNLLQSQSFDNASWTKTNATISANAIAAPDGATTADKLQETTATGPHQAFQNVATVTTGQQTFSVFLKAGERSAAVLRLYRASNDWETAVFDLSTGAMTQRGSSSATTFTGITTNVVSVGGGWYRCSVTATIAAATIWVIHAANASSGLAFVATTGEYSYTGTAGSGIYAWQAQLVTASTAGPLIVTTTAAATRGEALLTHNIFADGSALTDQDMLIWAKGTSDDLSDSFWIQIDDGTANNRVSLWANSTGDFRTTVVSAGVNVISAATSAGFVVAGTEVNLFAYRDAAAGTWRFGKVVGSSLTWASAAAVAVLPVGMARVRPGNDLGGNPLRGTLDSAFIDYGTFATDAEVIAAITGAP